MDWKSLKRGLTTIGVLEDGPPALAPAASTPAKADTPAHPNLHASGAIVITEDIDQHFVAALKEAAAKSQVKGFQEFEDQLDALRDDEPDEGKRVRLAAKSTARAHKIDPQQIVDSLRDRLRLLDMEFSETEAGFAKQSEIQVGTKETAIKTLDTQIALKQQEIDQLRKQKQTSEADVVVLRQKIETAQMKFEAAYRAVKSEYETTLGKITVVLK